jgi:hypothetical protein
MEEEPETPLFEIIAIEKLPAELGFVESPELQELRPTVIEALKSGNHTAIKESLSGYQAVAEKLVEQQEGHAYDRAQIGLIVATGLLWREAGKDNSYGAELWNARNYARNMEYNEIVAALDAAYAQVQQAHEESNESTYKGPTTEEIIAICKRELPPQLHEELELLYALPPKRPSRRWPHLFTAPIIMTENPKNPTTSLKEWAGQNRRPRRRANNT